ncbi:MAG: hypothetical protein J6A08_07365 [Lachnospiraceae bacterium]|nr:hypothetical protein [Lachnospiraceae bacterium]
MGIINGTLIRGIGGTDSGSSNSAMRYQYEKNRNSNSGASDKFARTTGNIVSLGAGLVGKGSSSGSGSSRKSGSSGGTAAGYSGLSNYQSQLAALYGSQQSQLADLQAQQRAAAEEAYRNGMANLNESWNAKTSALSSNLNNTLASLKRQYQNSKNEVNADADKSFREAYVNYMQNRKNINQNLSAQGLSGGAAESTMAGMYNNYGNSRNDISTTLNDNLTSLENLYQSNLSEAQSAYNTQYAQALSDYLNYQNQMEQNLASNIIGSYGNMVNSLGSLNSGYTDALYSLLQKQAEYAYDPTKATNELANVSTESLNNIGTITDYAKNLMNQMRAQGADDATIIRQLANNGVDTNAIYALFGAA